MVHSAKRAGGNEGVVLWFPGLTMKAQHNQGGGSGGGEIFWYSGFTSEASKNDIKQRCGDDIWFDLVKGETKVRLLINPVAYIHMGWSPPPNTAFKCQCYWCSGYCWQPAT